MTDAMTSEVKPGPPRVMLQMRSKERSPPMSDSVTTVEVAGRRMAAGGGGFFRILPYQFSRWAIGRVNRHEGRPAAFYFHPWEIDPGQPRASGAPLKSRLRHYTNLGVMEAKLFKLLGAHRWGRTDDVVLSERARLQ